MEIEAKFAVLDEATWLKLQAVDQIAGYALSAGKTKHVHDTFVDTPDRSILASRHVCRKREIEAAPEPVWWDDAELTAAAAKPNALRSAPSRRPHSKGRCARSDPLEPTPR